MSGVAGHYVVFLERELGALAAALDDKRIVCGIRRDLAQADLLEVRSVVSGGGEAELLEFGADVIRRELVAARAGAAAFEQIVREEFHVGVDSGGGDLVEVLLGWEERLGVKRRRAQHKQNGGRDA